MLVWESAWASAWESVLASDQALLSELVRESVLRVSS